MVPDESGQIKPIMGPFSYVIGGGESEEEV